MTVVITGQCVEPAEVKEATLSEFDDIPRAALDVSIISVNSFLIRFMNEGWRDRVASVRVFNNDQATPFHVQDRTLDFDAELVRPCYCVRVSP